MKLKRLSAVALPVPNGLDKIYLSMMTKFAPNREHLKAVPFWESGQENGATGTLPQPRRPHLPYYDALALSKKAINALHDFCSAF